MTLHIHLIGQPRIDDAPYRIRGRKSWAVLAYLLSSDRPPSRRRLAALLFDEADDPLRALRWSLSEIRRVLGRAGSLEGDPIVLRLPQDAVVDVAVVVGGGWSDAVDLPGFGHELLEGMSFRHSAAFEAWLLSERRHVAAATEAILHEAALASMSRNALEEAIGFAVRLVALNPLDENHQALLIRAYRLAGDGEAAQRQLEACTDLFVEELGVAPGPAVTSAARTIAARPNDQSGTASVEAVVEAGIAAVAAGAVESGVQSLRAGVQLADDSGPERLRVLSRLALAEALIHSLRGEDEEGAATLHAAGDIAEALGDEALGAEARAELGYVDFLRARYDRAEKWLLEAAARGADSKALRAKAFAYLGCVESDRANYPEARSLLETAAEISAAIDDARRRAYAEAMIGRVHLLRGELDAAAVHLDDSLELANSDRWLAFVPWPQALRGELELARGNVTGASAILAQAFARACQIGDPCWEGAAARGLALVAEAGGDTEEAFRVLADARVRCNRLADPYVWLDVHILDTQCELGLRHEHPSSGEWIESMERLAARTGMKELTARALRHKAAIEGPAHLDAARLLAVGIDNPALQLLLADSS